jgi:hypothetical protein
MYGNFTRYGDITPLINETDNKFAILRSGDEVQLEFADTQKDENVDRHIFLEADIMYTIKYSINGFVRDSINPMPFHGMSKYPYNSSESYPYTEDNLNYISEYNTREYIFSHNSTHFYNNLIEVSNWEITDFSEPVYFNTTDHLGTRIYGNGSHIGGNYWIEYSDNCDDDNEDGFCDYPYNVSSNTDCTLGYDCGINVDYLPLSNKGHSGTFIIFTTPTTESGTYDQS